LPATGYSVGNNASQGHTWNGRIAHVQVFNSILSFENAEAALRNPGSITSGLRLYLPMRNSTDVSDHSGNPFHGTPTDLENASNFPPFASMFHFGATNRTLGQLAIPSNGSEPAGGVIGIGDRTKLTASSSLTGAARFITTEGHGTIPSLVNEPIVRDVYLFGNQNIPNHPFANESTSTSPVCHAVALDGDAPTYQGAKYLIFEGTASL
jgi:hypothetical protein